jgi:hypothetical protein
VPRAILVPTAERDAALGLSIFAPVFRAARALICSPEEYHRASRQHVMPGVVVGIGSDARDLARSRPAECDVRPVRDLAGRIDRTGCAELFD